jgi:hypothetical protein
LKCNNKQIKKIEILKNVVNKKYVQITSTIDKYLKNHQKTFQKAKESGKKNKIVDFKIMNGEKQQEEEEKKENLTIINEKENEKEKEKFKIFETYNKKENNENDDVKDQNEKKESLELLKIERSSSFTFKSKQFEQKIQILETNDHIFGLKNVGNSCKNSLKKFLILFIFNRFL